MLKQACMNSPVLAFADYTKDFLLEVDASKEGLGQFFPRNKRMDSFSWWPLAAGHSLHMRRTTIPPS